LLYWLYCSIFIFGIIYNILFIFDLYFVGYFVKIRCFPIINSIILLGLIFDNIIFVLLNLSF
jgi:hypothetical protein